MRTKRITLASLSALVLLSCDIEPEESRTDVAGQGSACLSGTNVIVVFNDCVSTCSTLEDASCTATLSGDTITVTSEGTVVSIGGACTLVCASATTSCAVTGGDASTATKISYAGQELTQLECTTL
ncbi:MAG: hypothetical protein AAGI01_08340 [Myxococcota bacterium]